MKEKIGFSIGSLLKSKDILKFASIVDKNENIHSIWAPESWGKEVFSTLGAISQVTNRAKIGTSIVNIYSRTPATIGMGGITLDNLSNKRAILGLGTSTSVLVENLHGIRFEKPLIRMKEYIQSIRLLLKPNKVNFHGQTVNIKNFKLLEHSRDNIPIYAAAVNPGMINVAKKYADGIILYLKSKDELKMVIENIKIENRNQEFKNAVVIITSVSNKDPAKASLRAARTLAFYISVGRIYYESLIKTKYGSTVEKIHNDYNKYGLEEAIRNITDEMLNDFVIAGSVNDCNSQIKRWKKIGIDLPILQMNPVKNNNGILNYEDFTELWK
ncbi:MAG: LLM class flavin-dependent oxidoreductase [Candidatus Nitrosocosmicus sp.]|nr:LLM class flavin-dependent oxidoreductase [Candidatus Nitrosocosmicus sp.]MDN5865937.1 LLM class flavin-dependent oxidoreductase [Candidatus Nitrosocosmicus sp.]